MKKLFSILLTVIFIMALFSGCARTKDENEPGGVNSNDGSLGSNISSMMDNNNMSSMKEDINSGMSSVKEGVSSFISSIS